jgi:protein SCO1/2
VSRSRRADWCAAALAAACLLQSAAPASAIGPPPSRPSETGASTALPAALRDVGIDTRIGQTLPLDLRFRDETGAAVRLGDYFGSQPVILVPVYYRCPMLCTLVLEGLARSLKTLTFGSGADYQLVVFSFDPRETPADARADKASTLELYGRDGGEGWHFLTGDAESIATLTRALGFRYAWDGERAEYVHASTLVLATPQGRIARYLFTTDPPPKDLRLAMVEASAGRLGTAADHVLLYCFRYDPTTGRYSMLIMRLVRTGAALTVLALALFIGFMVRQERRGARATAAAAAGGAR